MPRSVKKRVRIETCFVKFETRNRKQHTHYLYFSKISGGFAWLSGNKRRSTDFFNSCSMSLKGWMILSLGLNKYHTHRIRVWQPHPYNATFRKLPSKIKTIFNNLLPKLNSETYCIADILLFNHCNTIRSLLKSIIHSHILSFTFAVDCQKKSAAVQSCLK